VRRVLPNGNIEITVQLMPDAYAALMATVERDKMSMANAINVAVMTLGHVSKTMTEAGNPLGEVAE
jgi:hypothetical protein